MRLSQLFGRSLREDPTEAVQEASVWRRLRRAEGGTPDEFELVRVVTYKFQSLLAQT